VISWRKLLETARTEYEQTFTIGDISEISDPDYAEAG